MLHIPRSAPAKTGSRSQDRYFLWYISLAPSAWTELVFIMSVSYRIFLTPDLVALMLMSHVQPVSNLCTACGVFRVRAFVHPTSASRKNHLTLAVYLHCCCCCCSMFMCVVWISRGLRLRGRCGQAHQGTALLLRAGLGEGVPQIRQ